VVPGEGEGEVRRGGEFRRIAGGFRAQDGGFRRIQAIICDGFGEFPIIRDGFLNIRDSFGEYQN
jgi:hypothetical protein